MTFFETKFMRGNQLQLPVFSRQDGVSFAHQDTLLKARCHDASLRNLLFGGVAVGAAMFGYGSTACAACVRDGTTITCTGDLSVGVL